MASRMKTIHLSPKKRFVTDFFTTLLLHDSNFLFNLIRWCYGRYFSDMSAVYMNIYLLIHLYSKTIIKKKEI